MKDFFRTCLQNAIGCHVLFTGDFPDNKSLTFDWVRASKVLKIAYRTILSLVCETLVSVCRLPSEAHHCRFFAT